MEAEYQTILAGVSGSNNAKKLAATLIPRYYKYFNAKLQNQAINAQFDLIEDDDREVCYYPFC